MKEGREGKKGTQHKINKVQRARFCTQAFASFEFEFLLICACQGLGDDVPVKQKAAAVIDKCWPGGVRVENHLRKQDFRKCVKLYKEKEKHKRYKEKET